MRLTSNWADWPSTNGQDSTRGRQAECINDGAGAHLNIAASAAFFARGAGARHAALGQCRPHVGIRRVLHLVADCDTVTPEQQHSRFSQSREAVPAR
jgi:hypothetical protein